MVQDFLQPAPCELRLHGSAIDETGSRDRAPRFGTTALRCNMSHNSHPLKGEGYDKGVFKGRLGVIKGDTSTSQAGGKQKGDKGSSD